MLDDVMAEFVKRSWKNQHFYQTKYGKVSVVTSNSAYCLPRDSEGPHTHVEIGMWTNGPEYLDEYAECLNEEEGQLRVYAYVPVRFLGQLLSE